MCGKNVILRHFDVSNQRFKSCFSLSRQLLTLGFLNVCYLVVAALKLAANSLLASTQTHFLVEKNYLRNVNFLFVSASPLGECARQLLKERR